MCGPREAGAYFITSLPARLVDPPPRKWRRGTAGGAVEGARAANKKSCDESDALSQTPPPPSFALCATDGPPPPLRGGGKMESFSRRIAPESYNEWYESFASKSVKGGGAPVGASSSMSATHVRVLPPEHASAAVARHTDKRYRLPALRARSPLGAPRAVLAAQINATAQPRPRFVRTGGCGRYPHHRTHPQRSTSRTGHSAGRVDARAARERGYKPRPQAGWSNINNGLTTTFSGVAVRFSGTFSGVALVEI